VKEAAIVQMLSEGVPLRDAAESLGITYETARTYVKNARLRNKCPTQSALIGAWLRQPQAPTHG
jgi:DNA-binding CsgD family transcriptional regulator